MKKIIFIIFACIIFTLPIKAETDVQDEIISSIDGELSDFENAIPDYLKDFLPEEVFEGDFSALVDGSVNQGTFIDYVIDYLLSSLPNVLKSFASLLVLILITSIFNTMKASFSSESLKSAFSFCSALCISVSVFSTVSALASNCIEYLHTLCGAMNAFTPIMTSLYIMTGSVSSAAMANTSMMLFLSIVENFVVIALVPIVKICTCFSVVGSVSGGVDLSGLSKTLKNTFTGICVFLMSIFSFVMSYQSILTQGADSLSLRTARFAIGNFIPLVGGFVSDSLRTISSSLSFIKSCCGVVAIIIIVILVLPIVISLLLYRLSFSVIGGISKALGIEAECKSIDEASTLCGFILAIVALSAVIFIYALTIFIKSSVGLV